MKRWSRNLFSRTFWTYVLSFSILFLLMLTIMSVYLFNYYYNTIYHDFTVSNTEYLSNAINTHENNLELLKSISVQTGVAEYIAPFRLAEGGEKGIKLKNQLRLFQMISSFFDQIYIIFDIDDYLYNHSTSVALERFLNEGFVLEKDSPHVLYSILRDPGLLNVRPEQNLSGRLRLKTGSVVLYALPIHPNKKGTLLFVVDSSFYDNLFSCSQYDLRSSYLLKNDGVIVGRGDLSLSNSRVEEILYGRDDEQFQYKIGNERYLFTVKTGVNGFRYCTVQSIKVFYNKMYSSQWLFFLLFILLTIPSAIAIILLSKRLHKPVNTLLSMFRQEMEGNDFETIKIGIHKLVKSNQELTELMEQSLPVRRSEVIRNFVRGTYQNRSAFIEEAKAVDLALDRRLYAVVLTGCSSQMGEPPVSEHLHKLFAKNGVTGYGCELIANNQTLFVIFGDDADGINRFAKYFDDVGKSFYDSFVMAISGIHDDYSQVSSAYLEANAAYDNRFLIGESDLLRFDDVSYMENVTPFPQGYIESLKSALRLGDNQATNEIIDEVFRYLRSTKQSLFAFRVLYNDIISVLIQSANQKQIGIGRLYNVFTMSQCMSIKDLDNTLREVCTILLNQENEVESVHVKMKEAAAYMRDHYDDDTLSMNSLADHLSVSTVTLSLEFKEYMGMNPSEYLTLLRIERAKQLLKETGLSIKEVCSAVGYYSIPSFTRRFKQYTAMTPLQFRQDYLNELK